MKLSDTPDADRLAKVIDGLGECITNARQKCTFVQQKDGSGGTESVPKPTPDYATEHKCWLAIANLWGLAAARNAGGKSANAQGSDDPDPDELAEGGEALFGNGH